MLDFINASGAVLIPVSVLISAVRALKERRDMVFPRETLERYIERGGFTRKADGSWTHKTVTEAKP
jgi:hypothetical protein